MPFTAQTRMSGVDIDGMKYRKGASEQVAKFTGRNLPEPVQADVNKKLQDHDKLRDVQATVQCAQPWQASETT